MTGRQPWIQGITKLLHSDILRDVLSGSVYTHLIRIAAVEMRKRLKGSLSTEHPIEGDELRALRAWLRIREQSKFADMPFLFLGERGPMTRQAVNYLFDQMGKRAGLAFKVRPHMLLQNGLRDCGENDVSMRRRINYVPIDLNSP